MLGRVLRGLAIVLVAAVAVGVGYRAWIAGGEAIERGRWRSIDAPTEAWPRAVGFVAPGAAWLVGSHGLVMRREGEAWQAVASGVRADLEAVWGAGADDVWIAGGGCVLPRADAAACEPSALLRWDGQALRAVETPRALRFLAVAGTAADDVWLAGWLHPERVALHWDGAVMAVRPVPGNDTGSIAALVPSGRDRVFMTTDTCVRAWDGAGWRALGRAYASSDCGEPTAPIVGIGAAYEGAAAYGGGVVVFSAQAFGRRVALDAWDGAAWHHGSCPYTGLHNVAGAWTGPDETLWLVLDGGEVYTWRGAACERLTSLPLVPRGVGGEAAPWILGTYGRVMRRDAE